MARKLAHAVPRLTWVSPVHHERPDAGWVAATGAPDGSSTKLPSLVLRDVQLYVDPQRKAAHKIVHAYAVGYPHEGVVPACPAEAIYHRHDSYFTTGSLGLPVQRAAFACFTPQGRCYVTDYPLRVFLAHPKAWADGDIDAACRELEALFRADYPGAQVSVISGRDDFERHGRQAGGWSRWPHYVGAGTESNGDPRFQVYVVPGFLVGRGTQAIVAAALAAGRVVLVRDDAGSFHRIAAVVEENLRDWSAGWRCVSVQR